LTHNGKEITVTPKVLDVLLLLQNSGNVLEKGRLMKALGLRALLKKAT
jgi:DNA-binding winged helix-turn-helix (wHTH) protein